MPKKRRLTEATAWRVAVMGSRCRERPGCPDVLLRLLVQFLVRHRLLCAYTLRLIFSVCPACRERYTVALLARHPEALTPP